MGIFPSLNRIATDYEGSPSAARGDFCGQNPGSDGGAQESRKGPIDTKEAGH